MGEFNNKSSFTVARTFNIILRLCDRSSSDWFCNDATPQDSQWIGGRGNAFGGGASKHLLPANNEAFGGDDDDATAAVVDDGDEAALKPPGLDRWYWMLIPLL